MCNEWQQVNPEGEGQAWTDLVGRLCPRAGHHSEGDGERGRDSGRGAL